MDTAEAWRRAMSAIADTTSFQHDEPARVVVVGTASALLTNTSRPQHKTVPPGNLRLRWGRRVYFLGGLLSWSRSASQFSSHDFFDLFYFSTLNYFQSDIVRKQAPPASMEVATNRIVAVFQTEPISYRRKRP